MCATMRLILCGDQHELLPTALKAAVENTTQFLETASSR
jgi:hypothetical protein